MKLEPECVRDLLLALEDAIGFGDNTALLVYPFENIRTHSRIEKYTDEQLIYTAIKLNEASLIEWESRHPKHNLVDSCFNSITYTGHQFLDNIRSDTVWNKTLSVGAKIGIGSINAQKDIAVAVIAEIIKSAAIAP